MILLAGALLPVIGYEGIFWGTAGIIIISVPFALGLRINSPVVAKIEPAVAE
jgi:predicted cobalt transporter CbtA